MSTTRKSDLSQKKWFWENTHQRRSNLPMSRNKYSRFTDSSRKYTKSAELLTKGNRPISQNFLNRSSKVTSPLNLPKVSARQSHRNSQPKQVNKKHRIPIVPASDTLPMWLQYMQKVQNYSSIAVFLLVLSNLVVYGWTVYAQQLWSQDSRKLQNLQRQERQLTTHNEIIKNKMAEEAQKPTAGLVSPTPSGTIFLNRTTEELRKSSTTPSPRETESENSTPLSY
ncbi:MAG: hypothetical protein AAF378_16875 [Cyanobacteria bacterium P01_A01_bin.84]